MSTLAFLPWATVVAPTTVGDVHLEPIFLPRAGHAAEDGPLAEPPVLDVLTPYEDAFGRRISSATLLRLQGKELIADLSEEEMQRIFTFDEALAFSALSDREFFTYAGYFNRDTFACVVQRFEAANGGISVKTRRRDGNTTNFMPAGTFSIRRELHIEDLRFEVNAELLAAVRAAMDDESFFQAIHLFNEANADRPAIRQAQELVSTVSAFQQLLSVGGGKSVDTIRAFSSALKKYPAKKSALGLRRAAKLKERPSVREAWMHDLCVTRGSVGHGHTHGKYDSAWSPTEHLLLAAFVFPVLVKVRLAEEARLRLTDDDEFRLLAVDYLLACDDDLLGGVRDEHGTIVKFTWNTVLNEARRDYRRARALATLG